VKILVEGFPDARIIINTDADLLKHGVDVGVALLLSTFGHHKHAFSSVFDILSNVL